MTNRIEEMEEERKKEREREGLEVVAMTEERLNLIDKYEEMREKVGDLETEMTRLKISHKEDIDRMVEVGEVQSEKENTRRVQAESEMLDMELSMKKE